MGCGQNGLKVSESQETFSCSPHQLIPPTPVWVLAMPFLHDLPFQQLCGTHSLKKLDSLSSRQLPEWRMLQYPLDSTWIKTEGMESFHSEGRSLCPAHGVCGPYNGSQDPAFRTGRLTARDMKGSGDSSVWFSS